MCAQLHTQEQRCRAANPSSLSKFHDFVCKIELSRLLAPCGSHGRGWSVSCSSRQRPTANTCRHAKAVQRTQTDSKCCYNHREYFSALLPSPSHLPAAGAAFRGWFRTKCNEDDIQNKTKQKLSGIICKSDSIQRRAHVIASTSATFSLCIYCTPTTPRHVVRSLSLGGLGVLTLSWVGLRVVYLHHRVPAARNNSLLARLLSAMTLSFACIKNGPLTPLSKNP